MQLRNDIEIAALGRWLSTQCRAVPLCCKKTELSSAPELSESCHLLFANSQHKRFLDVENSRMD